jgi:hypothetical protein
MALPVPGTANPVLVVTLRDSGYRRSIQASKSCCALYEREIHCNYDSAKKSPYAGVEPVGTEPS